MFTRKQAENAAEYLGKGSHVNVVGRVQNNHYERDGVTVYAMAFTAEEVDYLDSKAEGQARRARGGNGDDGGRGAGDANSAAAGRPGIAKAGRSRQVASAAAGTRAYGDADVPF